MIRQQKYTIGVDIGTTSTKAVLYQEDLQLVDSTYVGYDINQTEIGMAEQDPKAIFQAVLTVIRTLMENRKEIKHQVAFISFSSAMHSVIVVDEKDELLTKCIIWADNRPAQLVAQLKKTSDWKALYRKTGTPVHAMTPLSKIMWLTEYFPDILNKAKKIIGIKEYILYQLTGEYKIDYSIASATGLFNIHELDWDKDILKLVGIEESKLSEPVDVTYRWDTIRELYAREMAIDPKTNLVIGASDGCLSNLGVGAMEPGQTAITIGTSGAIRMVTNHIVLDAEGRTFCYYLSKNRWVIGGAVNNGGNVMAWLTDILFPAEGLLVDNIGETRLVQLNRLAESIDPGADGLFFLPYLNGERAPLWESEATGSYIGLASSHTTGHMVRAAMEGVLFNLYEVWQLIQEVGGPSKTIKITGGFLCSPLWKQMLVDIFGKAMQQPVSVESSCLGAVMLGNLDKEVTSNSASQKDAVAVLIDETKDGIWLHPNERTTEKYQKIIPVYQRTAQEMSKFRKVISEIK
ncbi:gluconokinase [Carnobacterium pleistocenium]|uniref:gluconokinase n=1 Tax=Carnobacterium pleistocenium TaxID=181073 RepID=UPI0005550844|nr:gluconokinase [Carnobacterium pleistocenium]